MNVDLVQLPPGKGLPSLPTVAKPVNDYRKPPLVAPSLAPVESKKSMENTGHTEQQTPLPWSPAAIPPWCTATRPLSDIRELTEPSLAELIFRNQETGRRPSVKRANSLSRQGSTTRKASVGRSDSLKGSTRAPIRSGAGQVAEIERNQPLSPGEQTDRSSAYSLSLENVPPRSSSRPGRGKERNKSIGRPHQSVVPPPAPLGLGFTIPNRGRSQSPVKETARIDPIYSDIMTRVPSRTFVRTLEPNYDVLEFPKHQHPRISTELRVGASLFVGGGSVEGYVRITVDDLERIRHRRQLAISRICIDLLGVEEMSGSKRNVFLNLATELLDSDNPPPHNMVDSLKQISPLDPFWLLAPSVSTLPFLLSLPLDVGPPPFHSKYARIRYVLCVTVLIRDQGKQYLVRNSQGISVLSVYDRIVLVSISVWDRC
jgi:hypothetical protein